jgi:hypothetical protein
MQLDRLGLARHRSRVTGHHGAIAMALDIASNRFIRALATLRFNSR